MVEHNLFILEYIYILRVRLACLLLCGIWYISYRVYSGNQKTKRWKACTGMNCITELPLTKRERKYKAKTQSASWNKIIYTYKHDIKRYFYLRGTLRWNVSLGRRPEAFCNKKFSNQWFYLYTQSCKQSYDCYLIFHFLSDTVERATFLYLLISFFVISFSKTAKANSTPKCFWGLKIDLSRNLKKMVFLNKRTHCHL